MGFLYASERIIFQPRFLSPLLAEHLGVMAYCVTGMGVVIMYPNIADRDFLNVSPLRFVNKLMAANPALPVKMLTIENVKYAFVSVFLSTKPSLCLIVETNHQRVIAHQMDCKCVHLKQSWTLSRCFEGGLHIYRMIL